jgi:NADH-quinone oxidoreductase subunit J
MDLLLLAATALGAIGLYLMLPRERAPLVRVGTLLGAMALAGFFLFLVRSVEQNLGGTAAQLATRPPLVFYLFAAIMIGGAVGVVCQPKPVYAALYFVLVTLAGAGILVLLMAEFMAIVLIIIYAGAILVTYVFVIMLASQGSAPSEGGGTGGDVKAPAYDRRAASSFSAIFV